MRLLSVDDEKLVIAAAATGEGLISHVAVPCLDAVAGMCLLPIGP